MCLEYSPGEEYIRFNTVPLNVYTAWSNMENGEVAYSRYIWKVRKYCTIPVDAKDKTIEILNVLSRTVSFRLW